jgi:DNA-binding NtrC family response regulator
MTLGIDNDGQHRNQLQAIQDQQCIAIAFTNDASSGTNHESTESTTLSRHGLKSKAWKENCEQMARSSQPILIVGELGVGKENTARMIHSLSLQPEEPFVKVNCEALQESLCKEMFFGKGDVASQSNDGRNDSFHKGFIENAAGGVLFLHNCQCLPQWMQIELIKAARAGYFKRPDGYQLIPFRARLMASSIQDLKEGIIETGNLTSEFCDYFAAMTLKVHPLRECREEIQGLLEALAHEANHDPSLNECRHNLIYTEDALRILESYDWPGNLYELRSFVRRVLVFVNEPVVTAEIVRKTLPLPTCNLTDPITVPFVPDLKQIQRAIVAEVIKRTQGNKAAAARLLNLHRKALYRIIKSEPQGPFKLKRASA